MKWPEPAILRSAIMITLLILWEAVPYAGVVPELFLPALSTTLSVLWHERTVYAAAMLVTLYEIALGMLIASGAGILVGALVGGLKPLRELLLPVFSSLYAVPLVVLYPLFSAWFGIGSESKIAFAGLYGFFPVMLSTAAGVRTIDPQYLMVAKSMGASIPQQITRVIIPAAMPTVMAGFRLGGVLTIIGVVFAEMLTSAAGIGYLVSLNRTILNSPGVFAAIVLILFLAAAFDWLARSIERRVLLWQHRKGGSDRTRSRMQAAPLLAAR
jgi:NitT/TauT family transport system permease protein/taurine transport system permease protein